MSAVADDAGLHRRIKDWYRRLRRQPEAVEFFGLDNLDERLLPFVKRRRGTFVELGAFDGLRQTNTAWLEANRRWRGVLIEPIPEAYERCVENRPLAKVVNCACVSSDYPEPTVHMVYAGLMSIVRGARASEGGDEAWVALGEQLQELERYECTVPARTLTAVLEDCRVRRVDLLSLDVEGYELEVLKGLDLERYRPRHILVEQSDSREPRAYLLANGYREVAELFRGRLTHDVLYEATTLGGRPRRLARRFRFRRR